MTVIRNPFFLGYVVVYLVSFLLLSLSDDYAVTETLAILIIVGLVFSGLAWLLTKSSKPLPVNEQTTRSEMLALALCLVVVTIYLTWGKDVLITLFFASTQHSSFEALFLNLIEKLIIFVGVPLFLFLRVFNYSVRDFGIQLGTNAAQWKSHVPVLTGMMLILLLFNFFLGQGAQPIREGQFTTTQLVVGMPLAFLLLVLEVGLVEEFFFRSLVQSRLAVFFESEVTGIVIASLVFGLAHVPGLMLRGGGALAPLGGSPSVVEAVSHSIVVLSVTGFFMGIIWARTKNLVVLMLIHAAGDLLANFAELADAFRI